MSVTLTPEQIKNWRNVLCTMIGPYALLMSDEQVQRIRDTMQQQVDRKSTDCTRLDGTQ